MIATSGVTCSTATERPDRAKNQDTGGLRPWSLRGDIEKEKGGRRLIAKVGRQAVRRDFPNVNGTGARVSAFGRTSVGK